MARIKIEDISKNKKITKEEMRNVLGGISWGSMVMLASPQQGIASSAYVGVSASLGQDLATRSKRWEGRKRRMKGIVRGPGPRRTAK